MMTTGTARSVAVVLGILLFPACGTRGSKPSVPAAAAAASAPKPPAPPPDWLPAYTPEQQKLLSLPLEAPVQDPAPKVYPDLTRFTFTGEAPVRAADPGTWADLVAQVVEQSPYLYVFRDGPEYSVACGQDDVAAEANLSLEDLEPGASRRHERVDQVISWLQNGGEHQHVLMDAQRPPPPVRGGDNTQLVATLGRGKALLLELRPQVGLGGAHPDLEDMCPIRLRGVRLGMPNTAPGGHALKFSRA